MELNSLYIVAFFSAILVGSHAALPSEDYWESVLPNTPMPKAVSQLLCSNSGEGGVKMSTGKVNMGGESSVKDHFDAMQDQVLHENNPNPDIFFLEKDIQQAKTMNLHFTKSSTPAYFLPRNVAFNQELSQSAIS